MEREKKPRTRVRKLIGRIDWWVATKMLVILLLGLSILAWVIHRFL